MPKHNEDSSNFYPAPLDDPQPDQRARPSARGERRPARASRQGQVPVRPDRQSKPEVILTSTLLSFVGRGTDIVAILLTIALVAMFLTNSDTLLGTTLVLATIVLLVQPWKG